jgi:ribosomal protein S18 acetylase RimI-like enzyme
MDENRYQIRTATSNDFPGIYELYKSVAKLSRGIARMEDEVTEEYIKAFMSESSHDGAEFIAIDQKKNNRIVGEIHCQKLEPRKFHHVLGELTIAVDSSYHGMGLGKKLFQTLLNHVETNRKDILRVELITQEFNTSAIKLYESVGFKKEGRLESRIKTGESFEADIPMGWFNKNFVKH